MVEVIIGFCSLVATAVFGISAWIYARRQLLEAKKQNVLALKEAHDNLEKSKAALQNTKEELELFKGGIPDDIEIVANVHDALEKLNKIIEERAKKNKKVEVQIFGLDLQSIIPWFVTKFVQDDLYDDIYVTFRLMLINPDVKIIKPLIDNDSNISRDAINNSIKRARAINDLNDLDRLKMEMRQYPFLPIIHGYLVDKKYLGLAFTQIENGKIYGGRYQYICCKRDNQSKFKEHLFGLYESWFEFYWKHGKVIVQVDK